MREGGRRERHTHEKTQAVKLSLADFCSLCNFAIAEVLLQRIARVMSGGGKCKHRERNTTSSQAFWFDSWPLFFVFLFMAGLAKQLNGIRTRFPRPTCGGTTFERYQEVAKHLCRRAEERREGERQVCVA